MDKPKIMGRPPDHPWRKTGSPQSFLGCPNYFDLLSKDVCFSVVRTQLARFLSNHVHTQRKLGRPSGDFGGHVGSPDRVMGRIWQLGNLLSAALHFWFNHGHTIKYIAIPAFSVTRSRQGNSGFGGWKFWASVWMFVAAHLVRSWENRNTTRTMDINFKFF